jgi:hypothetical protein
MTPRTRTEVEEPRLVFDGWESIDQPMVQRTERIFS